MRELSPDGRQGVADFGRAAAAFCAELESAAGRDQRSFLEAIGPLVADLYRLAAALPRTSPEGEAETAALPGIATDTVRRTLHDVLGESGELLTEDLCAIYGALCPGVAAAAAAGGLAPPVVAAWAGTFGSGWGESALRAMTAVHALLFAAGADTPDPAARSAPAAAAREAAEAALDEEIPAGGVLAEPPLDAMRFRWPWRPYQERVLQAFEAHLADRRLHVVAAPGAGKTSLGLEAVRRLGRPAVVLSPTRGIRDQWIARLEDYVEEGADWPPEWASNRFDRPAFITSITYQALHARYRDSVDEDPAAAAAADDLPPNDTELEAVVRRFRALGVGTLVLDEAHHLRAEWWKALTSLRRRLPDLFLISLTATPPYDVTGPEWVKYQELCGPIDEEISAPELVKAGTLCPHQDYVWLSRPSPAERAAVHDHETAVAALCDDLLADPAFRSAVRSHDWLASPQGHAERILEAPQQAVAMLVFLAAAREPLPSGLLKMLDTLPGDLPALDRSWWQTLVASYLFEPHWPVTEAGAAHRDALTRRLRRDALLWRRELRLDGSRGVQAQLSLSPSKVQACLDIHRLEAEFRGDGLRQVVLTDYIRDDDVGEPGAARELGAWPVFRELAGRASASERPRLALLTGRLAVVADEVVPELRKRVPDGLLEVAASPVLNGYSSVLLQGGSPVPAFTALLTDGVVRTLVGTRALLGEGWDCPCVNSLVLCSFVGSFMLTNQMRGRAIRVDAARPDKTASVWHLAAVVPGSPTGLSDVLDLQRRFGTFVGVGHVRPVIESGLGRLDLPFVEGGLLRPELVDADTVNADMAGRLWRSAGLADRWRDALVTGRAARLAPDVVTSRPPRRSPFVLTNTLRHLLLTVVWTVLAAIGWVLQAAPTMRGRDARFFFVALALAFVVGLLVSLPKLFRAAVILVRHLPVDGAVHQMAVALRDALLASGLIEPGGRRLEVRTEESEEGGISVWLEGAEFREQALFADSIAEVLGPIRNPRYLITRHSGGRRLVRTDYHAVPQVLGVKKEWAQLFHREWSRRVGPGELVYLRAPDARRVLLRARVRAFSSAFGEEATRVDRWH